MTPREKAIELISKFKGFEMTNEEIATKQTALIVVDEILLFLQLQIGFYDEKANFYFNEVKKEITTKKLEIINTVTYIGTRKLSAGHFEINVHSKHECLGSFETKDSTLVDDISELEKGFESELMGFETFEELRNFCLSKIN